MSDQAKNTPAAASSYRSTLNMPDTPFPMRGDLPKREAGWTMEWEDQGVYKKLRDARCGAPKFILQLRPVGGGGMGWREGGGQQQAGQGGKTTRHR